MQPFYGYPGYPCYPVYDRLAIGPNAWLRPQTIIQNIYEARTPVYEARTLAKCGGRYCMYERNGRKIDTGIEFVRNKLIVNPKTDGTFDCMFGELKGDGLSEKTKLHIPFNNVKRYDILPCLPPGFRRNPDCPGKYIEAAVFEAFMDGDDLKFLTLPANFGWNFTENCDAQSNQEPLQKQWYFASAETMIPELSHYYAADIPLRKLLPSSKSLEEEAAELAGCMPSDWHWKMLFTASTASLMLPPFAANGDKPDKIMLVLPGSESKAKTATVLLSNRNYSGTGVCSLTECQTILHRELDSMHDGQVVFRDWGSKTKMRQREAGFEVLLEDLRRGQGIDEVSRHMIAVISDDSAIYSAESPLICLDCSECQEVANMHELQQAVGRFHTALINRLSSSDPDDNLVTAGIRETGRIEKTTANQGLTGSEYILNCTMAISEKLGLLTAAERAEIGEALRADASRALDFNLTVADDFCRSLSNAIMAGQLDVVVQGCYPYYTDHERMLVLDKDCINFELKPLTCAIEKMHYPRSRNAVLSALRACSKLKATNHCKRLLEVKTRHGITESHYFYSVPIDSLTPVCQLKIKEIRNAEYLFEMDRLPKDFIPIMMLHNKLAVGHVVRDTAAEAESMYISGRTRSGKTYFQVQQAVIRAALGYHVIVFDQTGAYAAEELKKHLPEEIISEYFSFWDLGKEGLPVNVLSLEHCDTLPDKKNRLCSVLSGLAKLTGDVQKKVLKRQMAKVASEITTGRIKNLSEVLDYLRAANSKGGSDSELEEIIDRLEDVVDDLQGLPEHKQSWSDYLNGRKMITVISTAADVIHKDEQIVDMLLSDLYIWKQHHKEQKLTIAIDEIEDLDLDKDGPISTIQRKGGKHGLSMILASQAFSADRDKLGGIIGNCGMKIFFRPMDADIKAISRLVQCSTNLLAGLTQGSFVMEGSVYNKRDQKKRSKLMSGKTFPAALFLKNKPQKLPFLMR